MNGFRLAAIAGLVFLLLVAGLLLFKNQVFHVLGSYLIVQDKAAAYAVAPAGIVHVVAGEDYRTDFAIDLYLQGLAQTIFFTGGVCQQHGYDHSEHGRQLAQARGIPLEAVASDSAPVMSTYDEAVLLKKYIDENQLPVQSVIVVSDPFHMRRARWTYERVLGDGIRVLMAPVPFERLPFADQWWSDRDAQRYIVNEYTKLVYYFLRYQLSWNWLARFDTE